MKTESESPSGKRERGSASKRLSKPSDPQLHPSKPPILHYALHHPTSSSTASTHILQTTQLQPLPEVEENWVATYLSGFQQEMRRGCPKQACPAVKLFFLIIQVSACSSYPNYKQMVLGASALGGCPRFDVTGSTGITRSARE